MSDDNAAQRVSIKYSWVSNNIITTDDEHEGTHALISWDLWERTMGKFKPDLTDPVASAKGWSRRQRRVRELERLQAKVKELRADNERLKAFIADRIRDARREEMLMQINYRGNHE